MDKITRTKAFMLEEFEKSLYLKNKPHEKAYRVNHTLRVAGWGIHLAEQENLDKEALVVGCLLHDLSYIEEMPTETSHLNHGRRSAELAQAFIDSLGFSPETTLDILHGIEIHVDDQPRAGSTWRNSILASSIGDADNLDRFDVYRLYETLEYEQFSQKSLPEQLAYCEGRLAQTERYLNLELATATATQEFHQEVRRMGDYFARLQSQLSRTV